MLRRVALACLMAAPVHAQSHHVGLGDSYELVRESENRAVVTYSNHGGQWSTGLDVALEHDGLAITIHTQVNGGFEGGERVTVTAPEGWVAVPIELDVADGQAGEIILIRGVLPVM